MGKRHHASRRRSYGRRQHEVRERSERPERIEADASGISVFDVAAFDGLTAAGRPSHSTSRVIHSVAD